MARKKAKEETLTYNQIVELHKCFEEIKSNRYGISNIPFKTSVILAGVAIAPYLKIIEEMKEVSHETKEYQQKINDLMLSYCDKDTSGDPILKTEPYPRFGAVVLVGNGYYSYTEEAYEQLQASKEELNDKYKDAIEKNKEQSEAYEQLLKKNLDESISFKTLQLEALPAELPIELIETLIAVGLVTIE